LKIRAKENMEIKEILHKSPSKRWFKNGIHSLPSEPMPKLALTSFTLYVTHIASLQVRHSY